eukprot:INCI19265.1.p1 GENE.INCI19265.1~~INCI19265.1.p1  ORF type:complete len:512 (-),score=22.97 INCI19265.1:295-1830(-)
MSGTAAEGHFSARRGSACRDGSTGSGESQRRAWLDPRAAFSHAPSTFTRPVKRTAEGRVRGSMPFRPPTPPGRPRPDSQPVPHPPPVGYQSEPRFQPPRSAGDLRPEQPTRVYMPRNSGASVRPPPPPPPPPTSRHASHHPPSERASSGGAHDAVRGSHRNLQRDYRSSRGYSGDGFDRHYHQSGRSSTSAHFTSPHQRHRSVHAGSRPSYEHRHPHSSSSNSAYGDAHGHPRRRARPSVPGSGIEDSRRFDKAHVTVYESDARRVTPRPPPPPPPLMQLPQLVGGAPPIWIVFDLNGTLASTTLVRKRTGGVLIRPNIHSLLRLKQRAPVIRLAAWSSAAMHNVARMVTAMEDALGLPPRSLFDRVLCRDHTELAPPEVQSKPWDTVKPLEKNFGDLRRVLLVEDTSKKSVPGEEANLILMPQWQLDPQDAWLVELVTQLCRALDHDPAVTAQAENMVLERLHGHGAGTRSLSLNPLAQEVDVRRFTQAVSQNLTTGPPRPVAFCSFLLQ